MTNQNPGCLTAIFRFFSPSPAKSQLARTGPAIPTTPEKSVVYPYRVRDDFLSRAEASFYHVLKSMMGERLLIFPKVSLAEIFFVSQNQDYQSYQNKIDRKRVDFLLCDPKTLKPVLAIELDDASHQRPDRQERDEFVEKVFADARLPLARIPVRPAYNTQELASIFQPAMKTTTPESQTAPSVASQTRQCPKCGVPMVKRVARRGSNPGQSFWGCPNYPRCQEMLPDTQAQ
jgi:hypothetical protein